MEDFFIDNIGIDNEQNQSTRQCGSDNADNNDDYFGAEKIDLPISSLVNFKSKKTKTTKQNFSFDNTYLITSYKDVKREAVSSNVDKILQKSLIKPGFEKCHSVPSEKSKKALKLERKKMREKTKGEKWFNMPATELTEEIKTDFELLKMRSVLDRKHVYKKNDITRIPKYFQVGKVIESPADFYGGRIPKSQRKKTMVDELLADAKFKREQKQKFKEIMDENRRKKRTKKNLNQKRKLK